MVATEMLPVFCALATMACPQVTRASQWFCGDLQWWHLALAAEKHQHVIESSLQTQGQQQQRQVQSNIQL